MAFSWDARSQGASSTNVTKSPEGSEFRKRAWPRQMRSLTKWMGTGHGSRCPSANAMRLWPLAAASALRAVVSNSAGPEASTPFKSSVASTVSRQASGTSGSQRASKCVSALVRMGAPPRDYYFIWRVGIDGRLFDERAKHSRKVVSRHLDGERERRQGAVARPCLDSEPRGRAVRVDVPAHELDVLPHDRPCRGVGVCVDRFLEGIVLHGLRRIAAIIAY